MCSSLPKHDFNFSFMFILLSANAFNLDQLTFNPLPNNTILNQSNLKSLIDNKIKADNKIKRESKTENHFGKSRKL